MDVDGTVTLGPEACARKSYVSSQQCQISSDSRTLPHPNPRNLGKHLLQCRVIATLPPPVQALATAYRKEVTT